MTKVRRKSKPSRKQTLYEIRRYDESIRTDRWFEDYLRSTQAEILALDEYTVDDSGKPGQSGSSDT